MPFNGSRFVGRPGNLQSVGSYNGSSNRPGAAFHHRIGIEVLRDRLLNRAVNGELSSKVLEVIAVQALQFGIPVGYLRRSAALLSEQVQEGLAFFVKTSAPAAHPRYADHARTLQSFEKLVYELPWNGFEGPGAQQRPDSPDKLSGRWSEQFDFLPQDIQAGDSKEHRAAKEVFGALVASVPEHVIVAKLKAAGDAATGGISPWKLTDWHQWKSEPLYPFTRNFDERAKCVEEAKQLALLRTREQVSDAIKMASSTSLYTGDEEQQKKKPRG